MWRGRKSLLGLLVLPVALSLAFLGYRELRLREMSSYANELLIEMQTQDTARPILHGEPQAGDAWDDYRRAVESIDGPAEEGWRDWLRTYQEKGAEEAQPMRDALVTEYREAIFAMQAGAQRERVSIPVEWQLGQQAPMPGLLEYRSVANISVLQAEQFLDAGDSGFAVELLLDLMQMGGDHMRTPRVIDEMIGQALLGIGIEALLEGGLLERGLLDRLAGPELAILERGLRRLDEGLLPPGRGLQGEIILFERTVTDLGLSEEYEVDRSWRNAFSTQLMIAEAAEEQRADWAAYLQGMDQQWSERSKRLKAIQRTRQRSPNPLGRMIAMNLEAYESSWRRVIARLRMLRMAVEYRRGRDLMPLEDPFGGDLGFELVEGALAIWTKGRGEGAEIWKRVEIARRPAAPSGR